jgi:hypothetical protein
MAYTIINKSSEHFNTNLYTGNNTNTAHTGIGFQPDFTWLKVRNAVGNHYLFDSVRGANKDINSNDATAEYTATQNLMSFDSDGYTVGTSNSVNTNNETMVGWNWKAGTAVSGSTTGSGTAKTYTGSVNATAGFSIIKYVGNGTAGHTIPHHLGAVPKMIITKRLDSTTDWMTYHSSLANTQKVALNSTGAVSTSGSVWNSTTPTSSVFAVGTSADTNNNDSNIVAYCFAEKKGYSKFGSYTGNGNADGTFVYTGFKPAWLMVFAYQAGNENWIMVDNKRDGFNVENEQLFPNTSGAEESNDEVDLLSNGFKLRRNNTRMNGSIPYIYMAFAEAPLVGTNNVPCTAR